MIYLDDVQFSWKSSPRQWRRFGASQQTEKDGANPLLDIPSLGIDKQEHVFIKGPSGSGKSTLLNLIAGIITPQRGTVTIAGTALSKLSGRQRDRFRADSLGFIFQMFNLVPYLSVHDNIVLPLMFSRLRRQRVQDDAETVQRLCDRLELPRQVLSSSVTELSIGQQQRVAAARALIGHPPLLIADEPTSALDADSREAFLSLLFEECRANGMTLLFVSHDSGLEPLFARSLDLAHLNRAAQANELQADEVEP